MADDDLGRKFLNDEEEEEAVDSTGETLILQNIKKKKEERSKKLNSIYMSYDKLQVDEKLFQNGDVHQANQEDEVEGEVVKTKKPQRLNEAVMSLDYMNVSKLLAQNIDINFPNRFGRGPLHNAILKGDLRMVKMILDAGADVTLKDDRGDTPLHYAVRADSEQITKLLLEHSECDVNAEGSSMATPLHLAASLNNAKLCKLLLEHMARMELREEFGRTALGKAMESGATKAVKFLFEFIKNNELGMENYLYNADKEGSTLLHLAVDSGFVKVVDLCLKYGARIRQPKSQGRSTAFHLACEQGSVEIVKRLLQEDPSVAKILLIDACGSTPLHNAAKNNSSAILELLIEHGANVNAKDDNNVTPLMLAASFGATDSIRLLMEKGTDPTIKDIDGRTALFNAVRHSNAMEVLLTNQQMIPLLIEKDATGYAPPHYAAKHGDIKTMQLFLSHNKAIASVTSDSLATPLHVASRHGWDAVVSILLEKQGSKIVNLQDNRGRTALHYAASGGHHRAVVVLLQYGATIERDQNNRTALHEAARKGSRKSVEMIVEKRSHCINYMDDDRNTALHLAAVYQHSHLVKLLLANEHQEILLNSSNQNILDIVLERNSTEVVETIVEDPRWREVLKSCSSGVSKQMIKLIEKMPHVAERLLDHCMQPEGDRFSKDYKIKYDLSLILCKENAKEKAGSLKILKTMAEYRRDRCLAHPLCFIVLSTKWKRFGCTVFLLNLFFFLASILPLTVMHVFLEDHDEIYCEDRIINRTSSGEILYDEQIKSCLFNHAPIQILHYFIILMLSIQVLKEVIQCYYQRMRYFTSVSSWIDIIGLGAALFSVVPPCACKWGIQKQAASVAIFLSWINLIMYFRRLPFYGKYVIMLYRMFITLLKVLVLFAFFIVAFGATFHLIIDQEPFTSLPNTLMNIFIMTLGEINYVDVFMPWSKLFYPRLVNTLLILFCLTMPIILMNMLVGLAVGDIDKIERNALIDRYIMQVELLIDIEAALPSCLLRRVHFSHVTDYPNKEPSLFSKVYNSLIGFGLGNEEGEADERDARIPEMTQLTEKLEEQASEIEHLQKTMETILQLVREQTDILSKPKKIEAPLEDPKASLLGKPLDVFGSLASTAISFGTKKTEEEKTQDKTSSIT
ncbi:transient receptor potential cation channel subfamily A member 1-like [Actinia tenebrosa]|uniref:Transient receptor potential cation channel subfamily A member 1-like n=1 Tax=Actinia tenebrosa TaxID=6105 RepID=A0A6P8H946_ACTTE|nr:transient receptor potential cation channel subfamily A member 1-like [Actinia tenebrosa]XP_031548960.1 transient receptor potential cation channel subfamily A member 1-like [Actinia tenebrosa]